LEQDAEPALQERLSQLARDCWLAFQLGGYARVDFRVDDAGQPWILEINTNPCLSPDAGYAAALRQADITFAKAVQRILENACQRTPPIRPIGPIRPTGPTNDRSPQHLNWRYDVTERDPAIVRELVSKTGFFYPDEVAVAEELVQERLAKGPASGYFFVFAEMDGQVAGYASYGHIACTRDSYDLYWIAVHPRFQGQGIGRFILDQAERCIREAGGRRVYIETSNREQYQSTRGFYLRCGYVCEAILAEFYGPGDDKVIYVKAIPTGKERS
jgi:GNAT superfamily N-acetyltransferase